MTANPQLAYAIVGPDGRTHRVYLDEGIAHSQSEPDHGESIIPVTIIPDADKVQWAARVLLDAMPDDFGYDGPRWRAASAAQRSREHADPMQNSIAATYHSIRAALRALAGGDTQ